MTITNSAIASMRAALTIPATTAHTALDTSNQILCEDEILVTLELMNNANHAERLDELSLKCDSILQRMESELRRRQTNLAKLEDEADKLESLNKTFKELNR